MYSVWDLNCIATPASPNFWWTDFEHRIMLPCYCYPYEHTLWLHLNYRSKTHPDIPVCITCCPVWCSRSYPTFLFISAVLTGRRVQNMKISRSNKQTYIGSLGFFRSKEQINTIALRAVWPISFYPLCEVVFSLKDSQLVTLTALLPKKHQRRGWLWCKDP